MAQEGKLSGQMSRPRRRTSGDTRASGTLDHWRLDAAPQLPPCLQVHSWLQLATAGYSWLMYSYARPNIASTKDASDRPQYWGREAPRDPGYDGVSGRPCSLAEMAIPDAVVRRHATNRVVVFSLHFCLTVIFAVLVLHYCPIAIDEMH